MPAMDVPGYASESKRALEAQLRATLDVIPAYTWYAEPAGPLTFVNKRLADYLGLPKDHAPRFRIATGAAWDWHIALSHPDEKPLPKNAGKRYEAAAGVEDDAAGERG